MFSTTYSTLLCHVAAEVSTCRAHIRTQPGGRVGLEAHYTYIASHPPIKLLYNINLRAPPSAPAGYATHKQPRYYLFQKYLSHAIIWKI